MDYFFQIHTDYFNEFHTGYLHQYHTDYFIQFYTDFFNRFHTDLSEEFELKGRSGSKGTTQILQTKPTSLSRARKLFMSMVWLT